MSLFLSTISLIHYFFYFPPKSCHLFFTVKPTIVIFSITISVLCGLSYYFLHFTILTIMNSPSASQQCHCIHYLLQCCRCSSTLCHFTVICHFSLYVCIFFYYIALFLFFYGVIVHYPGQCSLSSTLLSTFFLCVSSLSFNLSFSLHRICSLLCYKCYTVTSVTLFTVQVTFHYIPSFCSLYSISAFYPLYNTVFHHIFDCHYSLSSRTLYLTIFPILVQCPPIQPFSLLLYYHSLSKMFQMYSTVTIHYPLGHHISQSSQLLFTIFSIPVYCLPIPPFLFPSLSFTF